MGNHFVIQKESARILQGIGPIIDLKSLFENIPGHAWIRMDQEMDYSDPRGVGGPDTIGGYDITITLYTLTSLYSSTYTYEYLLP